MLKRILCSFALLSLLLLSMAICQAQSASTATIIGRVSDPQGAVVKDAKVVARKCQNRNRAHHNNLRRRTVHIETLPPAVYDITVEATGFSPAKAEGVKVQVGERRDVNFNLVIAGATGSVTVTSELPLVETTKTDVSRVVSDTEVATLPHHDQLQWSGWCIQRLRGFGKTPRLGVKYDTSGVSSDLLAPGSVNNRGIQYNIDGGNISDQVVSTARSSEHRSKRSRSFRLLTNNLQCRVWPVWWPHT